MDSNSQKPRVLLLAHAIRARRKAMGLTQIEVAKLAGCGPDFIYDVETGKPSLRFDKLLDLLEVLGIELVVCEGRNVLSTSMGLGLKATR
jgi:HTH-type transcriptional regulator / antitoxin HipB